MKSIGTRFSLAVGACAVLFCGMIIYRAWSSSTRHTDTLVALQGELALEFDLAIREYAGETIRPEMAKRIPKDDFVVEAMSTSYISRNVFEKVRKKFPDYVIKFSSDNPRNPVNQAGPEEVKLLQYFRDHPEATRWAGRLQVNGNQYLAQAGVMRIEPSCLQCHGDPDDCPKTLLARYGRTASFHHKVGDVAGLDVIAIPMDKVSAALTAEATTNIFTTILLLGMLFTAILIAFRSIVARRLASIAAHFREAAVHAGDAPIGPVPIQGSDEISVLARSFNAMAARLQAFHESLEERVCQRTAELERERRTLKHVLNSSDHERQLIAYEIHDGLAQDLAGAIMQFQCYDRLKQQNPEQAAKAYSAGVALLGQSHLEARRLINGVRPPILDEEGIVAAIRHLVHDSNGQAGLDIEFRSDFRCGRLVPVLENAIYRIVQECLANVQKHSQTAEASVEFVQEGDKLRLEIQDWGVGFNLEDVQEGRFGLEGIRQRVRLLGGSAIIDSKPGVGTRIAVELPVVLKEATE